MLDDTKRNIVAVVVCTVLVVIATTLIVVSPRSDDDDLFDNPEEKKHECEEFIIIDTDAGYDDVFAILMLLGSAPRKCVKAITTVQGISDVQHGTENIASIVSFLQLEDSIEVAQGSGRPESNSHIFPAQYRKPSNSLTGVPITYCGTSCNISNLSAVELLLQKAQMENLTLLCIGPLTNLATAIELGGVDFLQHIDRLIIFGGAIFQQGNAPNNVSEWNFYADYGSAANVLNVNPSRFSEDVWKEFLLKIQMIGLEVTEFSSIPVIYEATKDIETENNPIGAILKAIINQLYITQTPLLFDPTAAVVLIDDELVDFKQLPVKVLTNKPHEGQTVVDTMYSFNLSGYGINLTESRYVSHIKKTMAKH